MATPRKTDRSKPTRHVEELRAPDQPSADGTGNDTGPLPGGR